MQKQFKTEFGGRSLRVELSDLVDQANGAVIVRYDETVVLATAVMSNQDVAGGDYFPLSVEYEEKFYAAGKILGSRFIRREGRPSEDATLTARLIDRAIRPLFDNRLRREVQVVVTVLSLNDIDADFPGLLAASLALATSDIPWQGPIAGVRLCNKEGSFITLPTFEEREGAYLDMFCAGTKERINMIEASGDQSPEEKVLEGFSKSQELIKSLIEFQEEIIREINPRKADIVLGEPSPELIKIVKDFLSDQLEKAIYSPKRIDHLSPLSVLRQELHEFLKEKGFEGADLAEANYIFEKEIERIVRRDILEKEKRPDGRQLKEMREISGFVGLLPRVHGSAVFRRGGTHILSTVTLAAPGAEQMMETIEISGKKRFLHHYNFPPYCVGEIRSLRRPPGRREIGHGALAEKTLKPMIPPMEEFPYIIRTVSEVLASNGSSSMGSVCAASLALMDAGVPIKEPVAGIALGLITGEYGQYKILTDIQGPEDHHGDMDLKIAGTKNGVNVIQMDVKIEGINFQILEEALRQAKEARLEILEKMLSIIPKPRENLSPYAPKIAMLRIDPAKIGLVVGSGGRTIQNIISSTGISSIDIEDDGLIYVAGEEESALKKAISFIKNITREFQVGEVVEGQVVRILDFGAIVQIDPFHDGLLHISELAPWRVEKVEDVVKEGEWLKVKIIRVEPDGRLSLSLKALASGADESRQKGLFNRRQNFQRKRF